MANKPRPTRKSAITARLASSKGPLNRLRARRYGLDLLLGNPPTLEFYCEAGDPHSHLCLQSLALWIDRLQVEVKVYIVPPPRAEAYPEADKQRAFALTDAKRIAPAWGLLFEETTQLPTPDNQHKAAQALLAYDQLDDLLAAETDIAQALFSNDAAKLDKLLTGSEVPDEITTNLTLAANEKRRAELGHYLPGMWQFDGEWFWGLDRLNHLEARLREYAALNGSQPLANFTPADARLPRLPERSHPLEFFFSFRSPYSYLAAVEIQKKYFQWPIDLRVRPVLPMAMRGLPVPLEKRLYIVRDVYREADRLDIPFGRISDPIGAGAERCLSCFPLARDTAQQLGFLVSAASNIWSEGIDVATDKGLAYVCEQAGMDWTAAKAKLDSGLDLGYAEANRQALFDAGLWGVPSYKIGDFATWGRDRLWMIEEMLRRAS